MATIKEIAKAAGVSHSTVSRALNHSPLIKEATRKRVQAIAAEMDFEVNQAARSLNQSISNTIGLVIPEFFGDMKSELFFASLIGKLIHTLQLQGFLIKIEYGGIEDQRVRRLARSKNVDGLILIQKDLPEEDFLVLKESRMPYVFLHYEPELFSTKDMNLVKTDHQYGGWLATSHLLTNGRRKLMTLTALDGISVEYQERTSGFLKALSEYREEQSGVIKTRLTFEDAYQKVFSSRKIQDGQINGLFAQTDIIALASIEAMKDLGIRVPEDISVIGYDNLEIGSYFKPYLTTVEQPVDALVAKGSDLLMRQIKEQGIFPEQQLIQPKLIVRSSV
ncbi:LacI family DNA-binding transcriptional regulator [Salisediminibacterium beveridgei]|uniref:Transcriptional regulator of maltose utilization, LacI family n=1 Tax=Salisediminibacterium beveridgei TaxID=632773 RepID=A0A1D7QXK2_9BACI|nr:LacI family DNA-binding transcriptional regulator [Salisediminibacterium beveridgei]AOM83735.1 Transcriptional regulator of maltose utilization, LacI family [Salisediminibacterium beveridgei]